MHDEALGADPSHKTWNVALLIIVYPMCRAMCLASWHQYGVTRYPECYSGAMFLSSQPLHLFQRSCVTETGIAAIVARSEPTRVAA